MPLTTVWWPAKAAGAVKAASTSAATKSKRLNMESPFRLGCKRSDLVVYDTIVLIVTTLMQ